MDRTIKASFIVFIIILFFIPLIGQVPKSASFTTSGAAPGGTAGGDLTGTYPNPTITAINGAAITNNLSLTNAALTLGSNGGNGGSLVLKGSTSGTFSLIPAAASGSLAIGGGYTVTSNGIVVVAGTKPTLTGSCATQTQTGGSNVGTFALNGTCTAGTVILTFAATVTTGYFCTAYDFTTNTDVFKMTASSTSACTLTGTGVSADVIYFNATAF